MLDRFDSVIFAAPVIWMIVHAVTLYVRQVHRGYIYDENHIPAGRHRLYRTADAGTWRRSWDFPVAALTANRQVDLLEQQARQFQAAPCRAV